MKVNTKDRRNTRINGENIEDVKEFTYLGSIISQDGGAFSDVKSRIHKANAVLSNFTLYGNLEKLQRKPNSVFPGQMLSLYYYTDVKPGK